MTCPHELTQEFQQQLEDEAANRGLTLTELIRQAILMFAFDNSGESPPTHQDPEEPSV
jgi:hypothetical protein